MALGSLLSACGGGGGSKTSGKDPSLAQIGSPADGGVVTTRSVDLVVHTRNARGFEARLANQDITRSFHESPKGTWTARVGPPLVHVGANALSVRTRGSGGGWDFDSSTFTVARRNPRLLTLQAVRVAGVDTPVRVTVRVPLNSTLQVLVNGKRADGAFQPEGNVLVGRLGANDGIRPGQNEISVLAFTPAGAYDSDSRTVTIGREAPVASAGADARPTQGNSLTLSARASRVPAGGTGVTYHWQIVKAPKGSHPVLSGNQTATPTLRTDRPGVYQARVTVTTGRGTSRDTATFNVVPNDLPIGVKVDTVSNGRGEITIDGKVVPGTGGGIKSLNWVVLDRPTRQVAEAGTSTQSDALQKLLGLADKYAKAPGYQMIVNAPSGGPGYPQADWESLLKKLGAPPLTDADRQAVRNANPFSVIGIPGAPAGAAFLRLTPQPNARAETGSMTGYLRMNSVTAKYDFVFTDYVAFDTRSASSAKQNTISVGGKEYTQALPANATGGFHAVVLDPKTLSVSEDRVWPTNTGTPSGDQAAQKAFASWLTDVAGRIARPLLLLESIGTPKPSSPAWADAGAQIQKLGGTRGLFNGIRGDYALVGRAGMSAPPAEASAGIPGQPGRLKGMLMRSRASDFEPFLATPTGALNAELVQLVNQPQTSYKPFPTKGQQAAATAIGISPMKVCPKGAQTCDVRATYYQNYNGAWTTINAELGNLVSACRSHDQKCPSGADFTQDDSLAVAQQLFAETSDVTRVHHYLGTDGLQAAFGNATFAAQIDLKDIGDQIKKAVQPPAGSATASNVLQVLSLVAKLGGVLPPPGSNVAAGVSAVFGMAAYFAKPDGSPNLIGERVQSTVDGLAGEAFNRYNTASQQIDAIGRIIVSDPKKLQTVADKVDSDPAWQLPDKGRAFEQMRLGSRRWFYQTLLPVAYQIWEINPAPQNGGPGNARNYTCFSSFGANGQRNPGRPLTSNPFQAADDGQDRQPTAFGGNGEPITPVIGLASNVHSNPFQVPPATLLDPLFRDPEDPKPGGLGFTKAELYNPRYFTFSGTLQNDRRCPFG